MNQESLGAVVAPALLGMRVSVRVVTGENPAYDYSAPFGDGRRFLYEERFGQIVAAIPMASGALNLHILLDDGSLQVREIGVRRSGVRILPTSVPA